MHSAGTLNLHHKAVGLSNTRFAVKGVTDRFVINCTLRSLRSPPAIALLASGNPIEWIQRFFGDPGDAVPESISSFQYVCAGFYSCHNLDH
jgi:hypothetical protein